MTPQEVARRLIDAGWTEVKGRGNGSHRFFRHPERGDRITVPWHNRDLKPGTLHSILRQAGLK